MRQQSNFARRRPLAAGLVIGGWIAVAFYVWLTSGGLTARERELCRHVPYSTGEKPLCLVVRYAQ